MEKKKPEPVWLTYIRHLREKDLEGLQELERQMRSKEEAKERRMVAKLQSRWSKPLD